MNKEIEQAAREYASFNYDTTSLDIDDHFIAGVKWQQSQPSVKPVGWISVDDRLPDGIGRYWCYVAEVNDLGISHFQWNCAYHSEEKRWSSDGLSMNVTHWMELPDYPQSPCKLSHPE